MMPYLICGAAAAGMCFAMAVWRLDASRYPDQAYRAAAFAAISALIAAAFVLAALAL